MLSWIDVTGRAASLLVAAWGDGCPERLASRMWVAEVTYLTAVDTRAHPGGQRSSVQGTGARRRALGRRCHGG
jgi:hypothetical protein